jgi:hypothetical protein
MSDPAPAGPPPPFVTRTLLDYTTFAPVSGYRGRVQRTSVLYPLVAGSRSADRLAGKIKRVHYCWRERVHALGKQAWPGLRAQNSSRFGRMLNCCPAFAVVRPETEYLIPCAFNTFCPFCWARHAGDIWARLDEKLYGARGLAREDAYDEDGRRLSQARLPDHDLFLAAVTYNLPGADEAVVTRALKIRINGNPGRSPDRRTKLARLRKLGVEGVLDVTRVVPVLKPPSSDVESTFAGWQIVVRQLLLVPRDCCTRVLADPAFADPTVNTGARLAPTQQLRHCARPLRRQFADHVARVLAYPPHLLEGDVTLAATTVDLGKHHRMIATSGLFYGPGPADEGP